MILKIYSKKFFINEMKKNLIDDSTVDCKKDYFICIDSTGGPDSAPYFKKNHFNVIRETFDDVPYDLVRWGNDIKEFYKGIAMTEKQAENIVNFIKNIPNNSIVHIHCVKGQSRSIAIKDFINEHVLNKNVNHEGDINSGYFHIKKMLKEKWVF